MEFWGIIGRYTTIALMGVSTLVVGGSSGMLAVGLNKTYTTVVTNNSGMLSAKQNVTITLSASTFNINVGDTLTINSTITGLDNAQSVVSYQWLDAQNQPISGQTTSTLTVNNVDMSWNNKVVRLQATYENQTYLSNEATILVNASNSQTPIQISININPNYNVNENAQLTITPTINGVSQSDLNNANATYNWVDASNNQPLGYTSQILTINNVDMTWNNKQIMLSMTYNNQTFNSNVSTIVVNETPNYAVSQIGVGSFNFLNIYQNNVKVNTYNVNNLSYEQFVNYCYKELNNINSSSTNKDSQLAQFYNDVILAHNLMISGAVLVGVFGVSLIISLILFLINEKKAKLYL